MAREEERMSRILERERERRVKEDTEKQREIES